MGAILGGEAQPEGQSEHATDLAELPVVEPRPQGRPILSRLRYPFFEFKKCKALIIGNNDYRHPPHGKLDNCIKDAVSIADALKIGQFSDAEPFENLDRNRMWEEIDNLSESDSDFTWFHFSGHGALCEGELHLVPVDSKRNADNIRLKSVLESVRRIRRDGLHIFTLDMCQLPSSQRGPTNSEAIEKILDLETGVCSSRGRLDRKLGVPDLPDHEVWVYTAGEDGFAVADNGFFSTAIANFAKGFDLGPEEMTKLVTDEVMCRSERKQRPDYRVEHPRKCRYIITRRSEASLRSESGMAEHELARLSGWGDEDFHELRRAVEAEAASRSTEPGEYLATGMGWTPSWSLQSRLTPDSDRSGKCLIVLDGLIGCGKTTFLGKLRENSSGSLEEVQFVREPACKDDPDTWWYDLDNFYRVMKAGTHQEKVDAAFKFQRKVWRHHFRIATERRTHTFTEGGLGSTALVFCKVATETGLLTEGQREYFQKAYDRYMSDPSLRPHLVLYFKLPTEVALRRINDRAHAEDRESEKTMPLHYLQRLYCAYEEFLGNQENVIEVDANNPPEDLMVEVAAKFQEKLQGRVSPQALASIMHCFQEPSALVAQP